MELTQAEMVQLLRRRAGLNQGEFGARAFTTSHESGRTKIKNIELGKQRPTRQDLQKMAVALNIQPEALMPQRHAEPERQGIFMPQKTLDLFPGLDAYFEMLNKAVKIGDGELIVYITAKIAALFASSGQSKAVNA